MKNRKTEEKVDKMLGSLGVKPKWEHYAFKDFMDWVQREEEIHNEMDDSGNELVVPVHKVLDMMYEQEKAYEQAIKIFASRVRNLLNWLKPPSEQMFETAQKELDKYEERILADNLNIRKSIDGYADGKYAPFVFIDTPIDTSKDTKEN